MALDISPVTASEMMVERLNLPDDAVFVFKREAVDSDDPGDIVDGWVEVFSLDQTGEIDWDAVNIDNLAVAKDFVRLRILDFFGLRALINESEAVEYGGYRYKLSRVDPPFGVVRLWTMKLERTEFLNP